MFVEGIARRALMDDRCKIFFAHERREAIKTRSSSVFWPFEKLLINELIKIVSLFASLRLLSTADLCRLYIKS